MCEFVSWIEKDTKVYFLTAHQVFNTKKGAELREFCGSNAAAQDDYVGHGAIRHFYGLDSHEGMNRECTDFSSPANFPSVIAQAVKDGKFRGLVRLPKGLLLKALDADYKAKRKPLDADYEAKRKPLYADYEAKRKPLDADYEAKLKPLDADYKAKRKPLYADYEAKLKPLDADYKAKRKPLYADYEAKLKALDADYEAKLKPLDAEMWDLFADPKNRAKAWR